MSIHRATLRAYEIKEELGGGFRGMVTDHKTKTTYKSEVLPTLDAARYWAKAKGDEIADGAFYQLAPLRRRGAYLSNLWM